MKLLMLRSMWTGPSNLHDLVAQTQVGGFDGLEGPIPADPQQRRLLKQLLTDHHLVFIAEATTGGDRNSPQDWWIVRPEKTMADHVADLQATVDLAESMGALFVSTMCGYDAWSWSQQVEFFGQALELEKNSGVTISFETHRGRSLFNPWITRDLLQQFPAMKLTCDFSHWVVVCERLLDSEPEILELCAQRAHHIHSRVGYPQHAQVSDPRAPEYQTDLEAHERWWQLIWHQQRQRGLALTTMTPEYLWDGYMQTLPYTRQPVADLWEITCWMAERERKHFADLEEH